MGMAAAALAVPGCGRRSHLESWRGVLFGSEVGITILGVSSPKADGLWNRCEEEMGRLARIFSLSDPDSPLVRLNRVGRLDEAPPELVEVTEEALVLAERSGGVFDPTIQPYWVWLQERLDGGEEPTEKERRERLALVDYREVRIDARRIWFEKVGMRMTLNAMAQGFVTDRVVELLEMEGVKNCLVNIGEFAARGRGADGKPWRVAVRAGGADGKVLDGISLEDEALAVSSGAGHRMTATGAWTHLLSPGNGESPEAGRTVAVVAPKAVTADGLATACGLVTEQAGRALLRGDAGAEVRYYP